eukprot:scaffold35109_cov69-Phaeocystis_antarctica.AAC.2
MPEHTKSSAPTPTSCTPTTCGCASIAATTAVSAPASTAGCLLPSSSRHTPATRAQASSATRGNHPCARSAATAATTPIWSTSSPLGGASCGAGPTRCRCRKPPASASPSSASPCSTLTSGSRTTVWRSWAPSSALTACGSAWSSWLCGCTAAAFGHAASAIISAASRAGGCAAKLA